MEGAFESEYSAVDCCGTGMGEWPVSSQIVVCRGKSGLMNGNLPDFDSCGGWN